MNAGRLTTRFAFSIFSFLISGAPRSAAAAGPTCTESQAFNKMMAIQRAQSRMIPDLKHNSEAMHLTIDTGSVGPLLAEKKFDQACAKYDEIARKYGVDIEKEMKGLITYEELQKDGGKRGGICSQADASIKLMKIHEAIEDKVANGDADRDLFRKYGDDTGKFAELMYTDPSEMCRKLDELKSKYGVK